MLLWCQIWDVMFDDNYGSIFDTIYIHRWNFGLGIITMYII